MLTLQDRLAHLTYREACGLLGHQGESLLRQGGKYNLDISDQVKWEDHSLRVDLGEEVVTVALDPQKRKGIRFSCSRCPQACEHSGAAFALILEEKLSLGLSAPPPEKEPLEMLSNEELVRQAIEEREERARTERMKWKSMDPKVLWTDYAVTNNQSGKTYRVALRGWERGDSYCSCPDFRKNTLGTCKHILFVSKGVKKKFSPRVKNTAYQPDNIAIHILYGEEMELRLLLPPNLDPRILKLLRPLTGRPVTDLRDLLGRIKEVERLGREVIVYPDAEEFISRGLYREKIKDKIVEIRKDPRNHPLRKTLLKGELLPFQLDGIAFAVGAGRAVLADDMGLGKTIQGIGVAEMLSREAGITKVLIICPASVKFNWRQEISRFSGKEWQLILGPAAKRAPQYGNSCFFTVCNYEQVLRDLLTIERVPWDLIILDEGQRIKNWEAKTSRVLKALKSPFALVLTGTPLENRLDDLYSVVEFIDDRRLGPAFRFFHRHRITDGKGRVQGYKNLDVLRANLRPILLRRTRKGVMADLPPRATEIRRIPPTDEQLEVHDGQMRIIQIILAKKYVTEMDLLRLQKALLLCRMAANSTFLVDKVAPGYSSKLPELENLIEQLTAEEDRKIVLFSEWTTMLDLIEPLLDRRKLKYVRLDGSVPQKSRPGLISRFQKEAGCNLFLSTNAGATGLNLQAANTVINVDLPWNPAVLEQRISRVHRMGQKKPVQAFLLVTQDTLEEKLLTTLSAKNDLAMAALDPDASVKTVSFAGGIEELKRRLEVLLGAKPEAPPDESKKAEVEREAALFQRKEKMTEAGGRLLQAALAFIGEILPPAQETERTLQIGDRIKQNLSQCLERDEKGRPRLTFTLPDESIIDHLAKSFARILGPSMEGI